jgi:hypothetical protein
MGKIIVQILFVVIFTLTIIVLGGIVGGFVARSGENTGFDGLATLLGYLMVSGLIGVIVALFLVFRLAHEWVVKGTVIAQVYLTSRTIEWPNGADFAPEFLLELAQSSARPEQPPKKQMQPAG